MLQWLGSGSGTYYDLIAELEDVGFFHLVLPFLLIFALVYGIMSKIEMFKDNKGVNAIISLAVGLLALWQGYVTEFFAIIFPRAGIGLSILLVMLIMVGIFVPFDWTNKAWGNYIFLGVGAFIFLIVTFTSLDTFTWWNGGFSTEYWSSIFVAILIIAAIVVVIATSSRSGAAPR